MARSFNQVTLMGNLTRDPEVRQIPNGSSVCSFSLALNRSFKGADGNWQEVVDFVDVIAWGPLGERVAQYVTKGRPVLVTGRLQSSQWEKDGVKRTKIEVVANDVTFLGGRGEQDGASSGGEDSSSGSSAPAASAPAKAKDKVVTEIDEDEPINLDDIPF